MHARFFMKTSVKERDPRGGFSCLHGMDAITAKVSDHHPIIHNGALFWNIMMQGKKRGEHEYNNGFGLEESEAQYLRRLDKVAQVIAEIVGSHPSIEIIGMCEGPVVSSHVNKFMQFLKSYPGTSKYIKDDKFYQPSMSGDQWGLLMLADKNYQIAKVDCPFVEARPRLEVFDKLANRFQLWKLTQNGKEKYFALAHFPFGGDVFVDKKENLSLTGGKYCQLVNALLEKHATDAFIFCADFNFNPYLINRWQDRMVDHVAHHNSMLLTREDKNCKPVVQTVHVDGVLLSVREKQKYSLHHEAGLFKRLVREYGLYQGRVGSGYSCKM